MEFDEIEKYLLDWIDESKIVKHVLGKNPKATELFNLHYGTKEICLMDPSPLAVQKLEQLIDNGNGFKNPELNLSYWMSANIEAIHLIEKYIDFVDWNTLSGNKNAVHLLKKNKSKISYDMLSGNENAIDLIEENLKEANWMTLSGNINAVHLLKQNPRKINYKLLSTNKNAIELIEQNLDKIDYNFLSVNENAMHILENHEDKVNYDLLTLNPSIFRNTPREKRERNNKPKEGENLELVENVSKEADTKNVNIDSNNEEIH